MVVERATACASDASMLACNDDGVLNANGAPGPHGSVVHLRVYVPPRVALAFAAIASTCGNPFNSVADAVSVVERNKKFRSRNTPAFVISRANPVVLFAESSALNV